MVLFPIASPPVELFINVPLEEVDDFPWAPSVHALCGSRFTELEDDLLLFGEPGKTQLLVHLRGNVPESASLSAHKLLHPITVGEPVEQFFVETAGAEDEPDIGAAVVMLLDGPSQDKIEETRFEQGFGKTDCEAMAALLPGIWERVGAYGFQSEVSKIRALLREWDRLREPLLKPTIPRCPKDRARLEDIRAKMRRLHPQTFFGIAVNLLAMQCWHQHYLSVLAKMPIDDDETAIARFAAQLFS